MLFWDLAPPMPQNSGICHNSTRPHLHFNGLPPNIASIRRLYIGFMMRYKYYKQDIRSGFAWEPPMRRSRSKSARKYVFRTTIGVCKILSRSAEIWQYEDQKPFC